MPYYCTVPRCTSMAGKAKNVSFHQFPRDEALAKLWNVILKRGKPYTKYSKVCSLHFKPEDYTITSVGKNKGQWRTLRKDAVPSQNLPLDSPESFTRRERKTGTWAASSPPQGFIDPTIHQQMAHAIYVQTMLAMQAAGATDSLSVNPLNGTQTVHKGMESESQNSRTNPNENSSYKCTECPKYFKDPDTYLIHKRCHSKDDSSGSEKENSDIQMMKANPILANLLRSNTEGSVNSFDTNNILSIENHIMAALAVNMENYFRNISSIFSGNEECTDEGLGDERGSDVERENVIGMNESGSNDELESNERGSDEEGLNEKADLDESTDSNKLEIDESV